MKRYILCFYFLFFISGYLIAEDKPTDEKNNSAVKTSTSTPPMPIRIYSKDYIYAVPVAANKTDFMENKYTYVMINLRDRTFNPITYEQMVEDSTIDDSIEGFNRVMDSTNYGLVMYVFKPIAIGYATICPRFLIDGFSNLTDNLEFLVRGFSCMLQGRFGDSGVEGLRFLTNTVLGVAGFFEVADPWFGLKRKDEDFGQAFASWGMGPGCYLVLPVQGPTSLRDSLGLIFDYALDPKSYIYGAQWFAKINNGSDSFIYDYEKINESNKDSYEFMKTMWTLYRKWKINN